MKDESDFSADTIEKKISLIESILFVSGEPVEPEKLINFLECASISEFDIIIKKMEEGYKEDGRGLSLNRSGGGLYLSTKPELHESLNEFFTIKRSSKLTIPSLETLAIVAYREPVTLAEISDLRNVNSTGPVKSLLQKKLIKISGRKKVPGLPLLYSTTKEFLLYFGLDDISQLPSLEELTELFEDKEQPSLFNK
ncbi:MAG: SMC-Scp complex subunit ScpB [Acidobacteriota bacterium]